MKKAFGYCRVSTDEQAQHGVSLDAQRDRIEAYCRMSGFDLVAVYVDAGISGKKANNRPELKRALDAVCASGGALVVFSLSRLSRSIKDTLAISDRLNKAGADLVSLSESIDTTSAAGRMVFHVLAVLCQFEREQIGERVREAARFKKSKGEVYATVPFGYDRDGNALIENREEQAILNRIRAMRDEGASLRDIAATLNAEGIKGKKGGTWGPSSVRYVIANRSNGALAA